MNSAETGRLLAYHSFDSSVVETVAEVAEEQRAATREALARKLPDNKLYIAPDGSAIEVLDILPESDYDGSYIYHVPMANALDPNITMHIATLAAAEPNKRVIAAGNPSTPGHNAGKLKLSDLSTVWRGNLRPAIEPVLHYIDSQGIETATHIGMSYGADRVTTAAIFAEKHDQNVPCGVLIDPASVKVRSLIRLAYDFARTNKHLDEYVQAANCEAYLETRKLAEEQGHGMAGYLLGLGRLSNLAIAHALTQNLFEDRTRAALEAQTNMKASILWGSRSELAVNESMLGITSRLLQDYGKQRVAATALEDQTHAMGEDIYLHVASILQGLKN